tara:strand:- start:681 stop:887 length:207 start_codon:yes stop_codon:yes gene_type:complete
MNMNKTPQPVTLAEALELGFKIDKVTVHSNISAQMEDRWLVLLKGVPISSHRTSADALGRVIELATPF